MTKPMGVALLVLSLVFVIYFLAKDAHGHDFFSNACCSDRDCGPAKLGSVVWTPAGWAVALTGETVPFDDTRIQYNPPDEPGIFICKVPAVKRLRCLYLPEPQG